MDDRAWIYTGWNRGGDVTADWIEKTEAFLNQAFSKLKGGKKTLGVPVVDVETRIDRHIFNHGFTRDYIRWTYHVEANCMRDEVVRQRIEDLDADAGVGGMLDDFHEAHFDERRREEEPEATVKAYYDMLAAAQQPLHGYTKISQLDAIARLMAVKS